MATVIDEDPDQYEDRYDCPRCGAPCVATRADNDTLYRLACIECLWGEQFKLD